MSSMEEPDELGNTIVTRGAKRVVDDGSSTPRLQMIVIGDGTTATHLLPEQGAIVIGRSPTCDVTIDDHTISRRHAILAIGEKTTVEDLGSANGTRVRGSVVKFGEPVALAIGELFSLGDVNIILQQRSTTFGLRKVLSAQEFDSRLVEECARTQRSGVQFTLLQLKAGAAPQATVVEQTLFAVLRETDIVGRFEAGDYKVLLLDTPAASAEGAMQRIERKLVQRGIAARYSIAVCPRDGTTAPQLNTRLQVRPPEPPPAVPKAPPSDIVVADPQMQSLHHMIEQVAGAQISVLLLGETGVGKEVFARAVHRQSTRANGPFIELNCAALTETLLESELFGHEKGAFTNATATKPGLIETADGGTLFLDEIGDMPLTTQAKLLRIIEDSKLRRVGSLKARTIDVRFVAATNIDLEARIALGAFRRDLFYRLSGITLVIPPLCERQAEIEPLAQAFIGRAWTRDTAPPDLAPETLTVLRRYPWPGNIRELKYMIERAVLLCGAGPILPEHLPEKLRALAAIPVAEVATEPPVKPVDPVPVSSASGPRDEEKWILQALDQARGNQTAAAKLLGISRRTLVNRLNEYKQIQRPRKGKTMKPPSP